MEEQVATAEKNKQEPAVQQSEQITTETSEVKSEAAPAKEKTSETKAKPKKKIIKSTISLAKKEEKGSSEAEDAVKTEIKRKSEVKRENPEELRRKRFAHLKLFNRWPMDVVVNDAGLKNYINLTPVVVPWSAGRNIQKQFWKSKKSIVERLLLKLMAAGHKGKKHYRTSNVNTGKLATQYNTIVKAFELIEQRTKKNPVEVFVRALETGSPREGIATIEYGGVRYPKSADMAPQRRVDLVLRWMTQAAFVQSAKGKKHVWTALADEIIATANNDTTKSNCLTKKQDLERQSGASR